jgi:hypothetical protein
MLKAVQAVIEALGTNSIPIHVVAEKTERRETELAIRSLPVTPVFLAQTEQGIGYARNAIVRDAKWRGYKSIAMIDDDQIVKGNLIGLLRTAARHDVTGVGAWKRLYGLYFRGTDLAAHHDETGVWLHSGSLGYQCFALNVKNALTVGNFDNKLRRMDDVELARRSYRVLSIPWFIYTGAEATDLLRLNPGDNMGGIQPEDRAAGILKDHKRAFAAWPGFVSEPPAKYRCFWKKLAQAYVDINSWPLENIRTYEEWDWLDK